MLHLHSHGITLHEVNQDTSVTHTVDDIVLIQQSMSMCVHVSASEG